MSCGTQIVQKRVEGAGLPDLAFEFDPPVELSTTYSSIRAVVRLDSGTKLVKNAVIDDDTNGVFHFEFDDGEIPDGCHEVELEFINLVTGKLLVVPEGNPIRWDTRARI